MFESIGSVLHLVLVSLGIIASADPGTVVVATAMTLAIAAIAIALHARRGLRATTGAAVSRPRRAIDVSVPLAQSDPDAAGHARPRAPGLVASAA